MKKILLVFIIVASTSVLTGCGGCGGGCGVNMCSASSSGCGCSSCWY